MKDNKIKIDPEDEGTLRVVADLGLVTVNILKTLYPQSDFPGWSDGMIRGVLRNLNEADLLSESSVALASKTGRPEKAYFLTNGGAQICEQLGIKAYPLNIQDNKIALAHRLCQAQIAAQARAVHLSAWLEEVLVFDHNDGNLRVDVLVQDSLIIEVEQKITRSNIIRAVQKFTGLAKIFNSRSDLHLSRQVMMVFNLRENELVKPIKLWSDALGQAFPDLAVPFDMHYCTMKEFMDKPSFVDVTVFPRLEGTVKRARKPAKPRKEFNRPSSVSLMLEPSDMLPLEHVSHLYQATQGYNPHVDEAGRDRFRGLAELAKFIYERSFSPGEPSVTYGAIPYDSIMLLREYLRLPANEKLLHQLQDGLEWLSKHQSGLILYRMAVTDLAWDVFMRHFGLSSDGPLNITVQVPSLEQGVNRTKLTLGFVEKSSLESDATVLYPGSNDDRQEVLDAISWVLTAIFIHPAELGLAESLWSKKRKSRSKS